MDGGAETNVDFYAAVRAGNVLLWTSPVLASGNHTFKLRLTGTKNPSSTDFYVGVDRVDVVGGVPSPTPVPTPPPASACSQYTSSSSIPAGYASPYDVVSSPSTNLMQATCDTSSAKVDLGKGDPLQYIYNTGYLFETGGTNWTPVPYTSTEQLIANAWYPKTANTTISLTSTELSQPSYVLAYLCTWNGTMWKCGCRDSACTQSYWQIQSFKR